MGVYMYMYVYIYIHIITIIWTSGFVQVFMFGLGFLVCCTHIYMWCATFPTNLTRIIAVATILSE